MRMIIFGPQLEQECYALEQSQVLQAQMDGFC